MTALHPSHCRDNVILSAFTVDTALTITAKGRRFSLRFKKALWQASGCACAYCGTHIETHKAMHVDHFVPLLAGGPEDIANYVCSCAACNIAKCANDIEYLRLSIGLRVSKIAGIVSPSQVRLLLAAGVQLPINLPPFRFETYSQLTSTEASE